MVVRGADHGELFLYFFVGRANKEFKLKRDRRACDKQTGGIQSGQES